jgi:hypothetical protein
MAAGADYQAAADLWSGLGTSHCVVRLGAASRREKQYSHTTLSILRSGFSAPSAITTPTPVYIASWV